MRSFTNTVSNFFLQEKGVHVEDVKYMDMPKEREKYNLLKVIGNVNLTENRFKTKSEADAIVENFLSISLP